jgi:hypothetical protein
MAKTSKCRDCGEEIAFQKNKNDRWAPVHPITLQPHRCETERECEGCHKTFKGASWMKVCGDCYRGGGNDEPARPKPRASEPLNTGDGDDDSPPF